MLVPAIGHAHDRGRARRWLPSPRGAHAGQRRRAPRRKMPFRSTSKVVVPLGVGQPGDSGARWAMPALATSDVHARRGVPPHRRPRASARSTSSGRRSRLELAAAAGIAGSPRPWRDAIAPPAHRSRRTWWPARGEGSGAVAWPMPMPAPVTMTMRDVLGGSGIFIFPVRASRRRSSVRASGRRTGSPTAEARNATVAAISSGSPKRPSGSCAFLAARQSSDSPMHQRAY